MSNLGSNFYKNVLVLTQDVLPSKEFKQYFHEKMFEKPNTNGFIHASHYLLSIIDPKRVRQSIQWPITDKKSEAKFRTTVKDMIVAIANENQDLGFPFIQTSHFLHASGNKFVCIMENLSRVALRTHLSSLGIPTLLKPKKENMLMLQNGIDRSYEECKKTHDKIEKLTEQGIKYASKEKDDLVEIMKTRAELIRDIENGASSSDVDDQTRKRLIDIKDHEIINMWCDNISSSKAGLRTMCTKLKRMKERSDSLIGILTNLKESKNLLNARSLVAVTVDQIPETQLDPETQVALYNLNQDNSLNLKNFVQLFMTYVFHLSKHFRNNPPSDVKNFVTFAQENIKDLRQKKLFAEELSAKARLMLNEPNLPQLRVYEMSQDCNSSVLEGIDCVLAPSPKLNIHGSNGEESQDLHRRLEMTPVEGTHKSLFSRYTRTLTRNEQFSQMQLKKQLNIPKINFDSNISIYDGISPKRPVVKSVTKSKGKYARLFNTTKLNTTRANMSMMSSSFISGSALSGTSGNELDVTARTLLSSSRKTSRSSKPSKSPKKTPIPAIIIKIDSEEAVPNVEKLNLSSSTTCEKMESTPEAVTKSKGTRRFSISDLVERYKNVVDSSHAGRQLQLQSEDPEIAGN